jgi:hypothetical protein
MQRGAGIGRVKRAEQERRKSLMQLYFFHPNARVIGDLNYFLA